MKSYDINLLPKEKNKLTDKILHFLLYYFRYIIVITQIVVIAVFFFRLREDQKVINLKQAYVQNQQILSAMAPIVAEAESLDGKIKTVEEKLTTQDEYVKQLDAVIKNVPVDLIVDSITVNEGVISITGYSETSLSIRSLRKRLSLEEGFNDVVINAIDRIFLNRYTFTMTIETDNGRR